MSSVLATNKTDSAITVSSWEVFYINCTNAELITVYDSNNNPYDCFKYLLNNVSWLYVLDGVHNIWVNDLSSIGYSEAPFVTLPTVTTDHWFYGSYSGSEQNLNTNDTFNCYSDNPRQQIAYDTSKTYAVIQIRNGYNRLVSPNTAIVLYNNNDYLAGENVSENVIQLSQCDYAICDSDNVTVINVLDANDNRFNAFRYYSNGIAYYYVLEPEDWDIKPTNWTNDLGSIGYHEEEDYIDVFIFGQSGTFSRQGGVTSSFSGTVNSSCVVKLYNDVALTDLTLYDPDVRYDIGYYDGNGASGHGVWIPDTVQSLSDMPSTTGSPYVTAQIAINFNNQLSVWEIRNESGMGSANISWGNWQIRVYSVRYNKWNLPRRVAYFTSNGSSGTTNTYLTPTQGSGSWYNLYDSSGNPIMYESGKTYSFLRGFDVSGGGVPFSGQLFFDGGGGYLKFREYGPWWSSYVHHIEYTVT